MLLTRSSKRAAALVCASAVCLASNDASAVVYSHGHGDIRFRLNGSALYQAVHLDPESIIDGGEAGNAPDGMDYLTSAVTVRVPEPTFARPDGSEWAFIGNEPGDPVWFIPEIQEFDRPWLGISTEELNPAPWSNFRLRLTSVSGPPGGDFSLSDSSGLLFATVFFATSDGIDAADQFEPFLGSHAHYSWLFTKPGTYEVTLQATGQHATAGSLMSSATYRFDVIPEPSTSVSLLIAAGASACFRRREQAPGGKGSGST